MENVAAFSIFYLTTIVLLFTVNFTFVVNSSMCRMLEIFSWLSSLPEKCKSLAKMLSGNGRSPDVGRGQNQEWAQNQRRWYGGWSKEQKSKGNGKSAKVRSETSHFKKGKSYGKGKGKTREESWSKDRSKGKGKGKGKGSNQPRVGKGPQAGGRWWRV